MSKPTDIAGVIQREHDAVALETRISQLPPLVAVSVIDDAARLPSSLRWKHKATITPLPGAENVAWIVDCPSLESTALWVRTGDKKYREHYLDYLQNAFQLSISMIPKAFDVDHLYNKERADGYDMQFLRLALVRRGPNRSHGGAYEKDLTANEAARRPKNMYLMDEISSMKYFGFLSPLRDDPRESEIQAYTGFAAREMGLDPVEVRNGILYLRQKASTPWARKP